MNTRCYFIKSEKGYWISKEKPMSKQLYDSVNPNSRYAHQATKQSFPIQLESDPHQIAEAIYNEWLKKTRNRYSAAYQAGLKARLLSLASSQTYPRPSPRSIDAVIGTAEYDAFQAGAEHGHLLWVKFKYLQPEG